jgi:predicted Rossmann fold flavoprotein
VDTTADVVILGAGAAGLMCAIEAGKRGRSVVVLERNAEVGEKIRISGGGRCNFTNRIATDGEYLSANPHFCKSALARYTPDDFIALVERHGITYHEKKLGQLFCDHSSREIIGLLLDECNDAHVSIVRNCHVNMVGKDARFAVETNHGVIEADTLVVATGGLSIPKLGATDLGYRIANQFGLSLTPPKPGLVPLVFSGADQEFCSRLSGVSVDAEVSCNGQTFRESILFTHRGLSGPAILQISSYLDPADTIVIDLAPGIDLRSLLVQRPDAEPATILGEILPRRLGKQWCEHYGLLPPSGRLPEREVEALSSRLHQWTLKPAGTEGFGKAEVTCGGVDTRELSSKTMASTKVPGLYFIGEVVDVTGHLGGYNFQWAWASGFAAGQYV